MQIPKIGYLRMFIFLHLLRKPIHKFDVEHKWEIEKTYYLLNKIKFDIKCSGLKIMRIYRVFEFYYLRFFLVDTHG